MKEDRWEKGRVKKTRNMDFEAEKLPTQPNLQGNLGWDALRVGELT